MAIETFTPTKGSISLITFSKGSLKVTFEANGRSYSYSPVTQKQYQEMINADSHGSYLNQVIRKIPGIVTKEL